MRTLNRHFPDPPIPLHYKDEYTLLVAVLLSAQCTDVRVNQVTPKLFELADTPQKMAGQKLSIIESIVRPCGLAPAKSKNIKELSRLLVERHAGKVPQSFEDLEALPGVGHKTASVVMSQAFGHPAVPIDTHIHRLMMRWGLSSGKNVVQTERDFKKCFPKKHWNKLHLQFIYYGRTFCTARKQPPNCCPICWWAHVSVGVS